MKGDTVTDDLTELHAQWFEDVAPGPWHPAHRPGGPIVLDIAREYDAILAARLTEDRP